MPQSRLEWTRRFEEDRYPRIAELPFDSERKSMTTLHRDPAGGLIAFSKGATESLASRAVDQITASGTQMLQPDELLNAAEQMASSGLRVLAFGMRRWSTQPPALTPDVVEKDLTIIGLVGIGDPIRKEAAEAIGICHGAGIATTMITGDHPVTANAVAKELGILDNRRPHLDRRGPGESDRQELAAEVDSVRVYARVAPEQKLKIVRALQARGNLVAMTGDGVNDAPALKQAEIGVAMGITGTDVARQASSLILLDDNFATIVSAVREGRTIYDNLRRFLRYIVTTNSSEILIMLVAPLLGLPIPLLPLQILWINLLTDGLPGLALAAEPEEHQYHAPSSTSARRGHLCARSGSPRRVGRLLDGRSRCRHTDCGAAFASCRLADDGDLCCNVSRNWPTSWPFDPKHESLFTQGLLSNKPLLGSVVLMVLFQFAVIYTPILNALFSTQPLRAG